MRPRTLLILFVVVLALGAFIWFYERELPSSEQREALAKKALAVEKEDVRALEIESAAGTVRLERVEPPEPAKGEEEKGGEEETDDPDALAPEELEGPEWRIVEPFQAPADGFAVDRLLDALVGLEKTRTLEDVDPAAVGLDDPRARVRVETAKGEKTLLLGGDVPTGGALVASLAGESGKAFVVSSGILPELSREPGAWRDPRMFRADRESIRRITLRGGGSEVVLARGPRGFRVEKPYADAADRDLVEGLLADLSGLTADRFVEAPGEAGELGLSPPRAVVEVAFEGGRPPQRIELGAPVGGEAEAAVGPGEPLPIHARTGGQLFETAGRLRQQAERPPAEWRSPVLSSLEVYDVDAVTVRDDEGSFELVRAETDWRRGDTTISFLPVSDLLFTVTGARAERLLTPAEAREIGAKLEQPALTFVLKPKEGEPETVTIYPPSGGGVPATTSGREVVLMLPEGTLQEVREKVAAVREAEAVEGGGA